MRLCFGSRISKAFLPLLLLLGLAEVSQAQPYNVWLTLQGPTHGYVEIPHSPALNPTGAITIEAWVNVNSTAGCLSLVGKNYQQAYWLGICDGTVRAYFRGNGSAHNAGAIPLSRWTHIAVVFDGATQKHYINGELIQSFPAGGPPTTSTAPVRIGSDVSWQVTPRGSIDEVRIWNVARTQAQIRSAINVPINTDQPGLVSVWGLNANANDPVGGHNGSIGGSGANYFTFPVTSSCGASTVNSLCLDDRFAISIEYRTGAPGTATGIGHVPVAAATSGLFWFFNASNWEVMVKTINGCALNNRYWVFSAATTNVYYRMEVLDVRAGVNKIYFNYPGPPAPAVTDTSAFATCP